MDMPLVGGSIRPWIEKEVFPLTIVIEDNEELNTQIFNNMVVKLKTLENLLMDPSKKNVQI